MKREKVYEGERKREGRREKERKVIVRVFLLGRVLGGVWKYSQVESCEVAQY